MRVGGLGIQGKIIAVTVIVLLFSLGINTTINIFQFQENYKQVSQTKVVEIGKDLRHNLKSGHVLNNLSGINERCRNIVNNYEEVGYCYVTGSRMRVLYHNDPSYIDRVLLAPPYKENLPAEMASVYPSFFEGEEFYEISLPVSDNEGEQFGEIRLGLPVRFINNKLEPILMNSVLVMLVSFGFALILSIFLALTIRSLSWKSFSILISLKALV